MGISAGGSGGEIREKKDKRDIDLDDERFAMKGYEHQTQYYETDQMGIIHLTISGGLNLHGSGI